MRATRNTTPFTVPTPFTSGCRGDGEALRVFSTPSPTGTPPTVEKLIRLIDPANTRHELIAAVQAAVQGWDFSRDFKTGVMQT